MNTVNYNRLELKDRATIEYIRAITEENKEKIEYIARILGIDLTKRNQEEQESILR